MSRLGCFLLFLGIGSLSFAEDETCVPGDRSCSVPEVEPQSLNLFNDGEADLDVYWIGENGESVFMGDLLSEREFALNSFVGHRFMVQTQDKRSKSFTVKLGTLSHRFSFELNENEGEVNGDESEEYKLRRLKEQEAKQNRGLLASFRTSTAVKFRNLSNKKIALWYDNGQGGQRQGTMGPGEDSTTNSYPGHSFCFTEISVSNNGCASPLWRATVNSQDYTYVFDDGTASEHHKALWAAEKAFDDEYFRKNGRHWVSFWPRPSPELSMWAADSLGQVHSISTKFGFFDCWPLSRETIETWREAWHGNGMSARSRNESIRDGGQAALDQCHASRGTRRSDEPGNLTLTLQVLSVPPGPRVFLIKDLFSAEEADHIVAVGMPKVSRSMTGQADDAYESDTRTSKTGWVGRSDSPVIERLFRRAADLLRLDEGVLLPNRNAELLQVVHYSPAQKYDAHHDWGVEGGGPSRFITLLLYLNDPPAGGQTAFPKATGSDGKPLALHPGKGSAVLFYNLLPDGNADTETLHAALPVIEGEKWLANFWIWDPGILEF